MQVKKTLIFPRWKVWDYRENEVRDRDGKIYIEAVFMDVTKQYHEENKFDKADGEAERNIKGTSISS